MKKTTLALQVAAALGIGIASLPADAILTLRSAFNNSALSIDAFGGSSGTLQVDTPAGATVIQALLYTSDVNGSGLDGSITFQGNVLTGGTGTLLTPNLHSANHEVFNVTSIVKPIVEGGPGGVQNFTITEQSFRDGETLVVVYSHATTAGGTAIILDGELSQGGDTTTLNFAQPYGGGNVIMSLADSFSFQPSGQVTNIDVTTSSQPTARRLTSCAGGQDDGAGANGALITAGGVGDSPTNPDPLCSDSNTRNDDELYNLALGNSANPAPFLAVGDTSVSFLTNNPSFDDNVYGLFFTTAFRISQVDDVVIPPPPTDGQIPVPGTPFLLGIGLLALAAVRRFMRP